MDFLRKRALGVEIDDNEIRAVELQERAGRAHLLAYDRLALPQGIVKGGMILDSQKLGKHIKELWKKNGFIENDIILGLSNQDLMTRKIQLPNLPKEKLGSLIFNHAQEYMPFPVEDSVIDHMVVGTKEIDGIKNLEILIAAARLPMVESFYDCFHSLKLKIRDIKISSLALLDAIDNKEEGVTVFVDISNSLGNLVISVDGHPKLVRMLRVNLAESTGLDPANAPKEMELIEIVLSTWVQILYNEIRSSIQYFSSQENIERVNRIVLSGPGSRIGDLDLELEKNLAIKIQLGNPIKNLRVSKKDTENQQLIDYTTCIGLALAGLE